MPSLCRTTLWTTRSTSAVGYTALPVSDGHRTGDRKARLCVKTGRLQAALTATLGVARDVGAMSCGFWIFLHEESHRPSDPLLLLAALALIGGPAVLQFTLLLRAARGIESPSSPRPEDSQPSPSSVP